MYFYLNDLDSVNSTCFLTIQTMERVVLSFCKKDIFFSHNHLPTGSYFIKDNLGRVRGRLLV